MTTVPAATNTELKVLSLHQPWATFVMLGVKRFETRSGPPNGDMRPDGVPAGIGGCSINRGDTIGIASTVEEPRPDLQIAGRFEIWRHPHSPQLYDIEVDQARRIPLGALLGTVRVVDAYPMVDAELGWQGDSDTPHQAVLVDQRADTLTLITPGVELDISDQLPFGDWTPGRWAIDLADPTPTTVRCPLCPPALSLIGRAVVRCSSCRTQRWYGLGPCSSCGAPGPAHCSTCDSGGRCEPIRVSGLQGAWRLTADRLRGRAAV